MNALQSFYNKVKANGTKIVTPSSAREFLIEYGKFDRYQGRTKATGWNDDYFDICVAGRERDLKENGWTGISHHDAKNGETVYWFDMNQVTP